MPSRFPGIASVYYRLCLVSLLLFSQISTSFATSCDPQTGLDIIGSEIIASSCVPEGMNDNTQILFRRRAIKCVGGTVVIDPDDYSYNYDTKPNTIKDDLVWYNHRVFKNKEGTYFLGVYRYYTGLIDEKSMRDYTFGQVYTDDIFTTPIYQVPPALDCQGGDFNECKNGNEQAAGSSVNLGTGRLSHDQKVFSVNSGLPLSLDISLHYRSNPFAPSTISNGWSHSYELTLVDGAVSSKVLWINGIRRVYNRYGVDKNTFLPVGGYSSPKGDYSTLVQNGDSTWTITEPDGLKRNFNTSGKISTLVDKYGNTVTFNYDPTTGKLASVTDPSNRTASFGYDPTSSKLITITDPNQLDYTLSYPSGKLDTLTLPGGDQWKYTYNTSNGLLETKTDPGQFTTTYSYDTNQKVSDAKDPNQKNRHYAFAPPVSAGKLPEYFPQQLVIISDQKKSYIPIKNFTLTDKDQNNWQISYDNLNENVRSKSDPLNNTTIYTYYQNTGLTKSVTSPPENGISYTTFYTYDAMGNVTNETEPLDTAALSIDPDLVVNPASDSRINSRFAFSYTYDLTNSNPAFKNLITRVDDKRGPNILTTTYAYSVDANGYLVTAVTDPTKAVTTTRYYSNGKIKDITDANQTSVNPKQTLFSYYDDASANQAAKVVGFLKSVVTPDGVTTSYYDPTGTNVAYDANGNNVWYAILDKDGVLRKTVISTYDNRNRLHTVTTHVTTGQPDIITTYGYDANDNVNSVKDAEQKDTTYLFDFNRQITKITDARIKDTDLLYGSSSCPSCGSTDKLTKVTDANLHHTDYSYDIAGRLEYETDPAGKKYHYTYHPNGKLYKKFKVVADTDILQVTYNYNNRGQITDKIYNDGSTPNASYGYDSNGRIHTASNSNINYTFSNYTGGSYKSRLKSVKDNTNNRTVSYDQYDKLGQRQQVTYSGTNGSRSISYQYDEANRPWIITAGTKIFTYLYDKLGRRDTITYQPVGITVKHEYDGLERLKKIKHSTSTATITFANYSGFDKTGNRKNKITPNSTETYHYDEIYRLTQTDTPKGSEKYTYDDVGNRTGGPGPKESRPLVTYAYDAANRMTHGKQLGYEYDDAGNQITRTIPNAPDKGWALTWDLENRLTQVLIFRKVNNVDVESRTVDFKYDPFDRRIEKKVTTFITGNDPKVIGTWQYLYDGNNIAAEYFTDNSGTTPITSTSYYIHGPGTDEHLAMDRDGTYYYFHADGLGSITAITDGNASPVQTYTYDSFGVPKQTKPFRNSFMYIGKEYDLETGLTKIGARYYDARDGRFISKDPASYSGGINVFSYVQNNPINLIDPNGLTPRKTDPWYGHNDRDFQRWFHHCWKEGGGPRISPEDVIDEAYDEWLKRGSPKNGKCWGKEKEKEKEEKPVCESNCQNRVATVAVTATGTYIVYRCIRMLPSLFPPAWPTIPANAAIP